MIRGIKNLFIGAVIMLIVVLIYNWISDSNNEQEQLDAQTALILKQVNNVSKLVVTEAQFAKVYTYENTRSYGWDFYSSRKTALIISNASVQIAYDLRKLEVEVDEDSKTIEIKSIPEPEIKVDPDLTFYNLENGLTNKFEAKDLNTIKKRIKKDIIEKVRKDQILANAENRLLSELSQIYLLSSVYGWKLEYDGTEVNSEKELKYLLD
ncbi:DUF4230 domain-containing protein [Nonlabens ponticola]|uniref:DUF4230 domain-containing protein n=1 Tax=Nonlabens ponticola TaxID=2496866 RepID=A0A3S9N021_9FLAO|nr:DUF4230 domain-containing protein [Nonlabens ponticola]AZQ44760.1 DUF4230 domain-containing protein [Nonlabens ponticola]